MASDVDAVRRFHRCLRLEQQALWCYVVLLVIVATAGACLPSYRRCSGCKEGGENGLHGSCKGLAKVLQRPCKPARSRPFRARNVYPWRVPKVPPWAISCRVCGPMAFPNAVCKNRPPHFALTGESESLFPPRLRAIHLLPHTPRNHAEPPAAVRWNPDNPAKVWKISINKDRPHLPL